MFCNHMSHNDSIKKCYAFYYGKRYYQKRQGKPLSLIEIKTDLSIFTENDNTFCLAIQNLAQSFQGVHSNGFIVLQIVNGSGIQSVFMNQGIGSFSLLLHCFP